MTSLLSIEGIPVIIRFKTISPSSALVNAISYWRQSSYNKVLKTKLNESFLGSFFIIKDLLL